MNESKAGKEHRKQANLSTTKEEALGQLKHLANKEKWVEKDFGEFIQLSSGLLRLRDEEVKEFYSILLRVPHTHLPRILYYVTNQRFIDFISAKSNVSFYFIASLNASLTRFIEDWIGLEESVYFLDPEENVKEILDEKIQAAYVKPKKDARKLGWESLKKIERVRLFYSLMVLQGGLNSGKIGQIYQATSTLVDIFVGENSQERTRGSSSASNPDFRKLRVYFNEMKGNTSEETVKNLYLIESINKFEQKELILERDSLAKTSQSQKEQINIFKNQLDEAERQLEANQRIIDSQDLHLELLRKRNQELEEAYSRLQEAAQLETQAEVNSLISKLSQDLGHEFLKLQRGLDKHIHDEKTKSQFGQIMSKIEKAIQMKEHEK
jgi:hypothetical protein